MQTSLLGAIFHFLSTNRDLFFFVIIGEYESGDGGEEDGPSSAPARSVREMAAHLARGTVGEESTGKNEVLVHCLKVISYV